MECAPILISVYHRLYTLRRCVEALKNNAEAKHSELYIVSDAAGRKEDEDRVAAVRAYMRTITGFKAIHLIERETNYGASKSIGLAFNEVMARHGSIIFMEDDILPSNFYLRYLNDGLRQYKNDKRVYAICGYRHNFSLPKSYVKDVFVLNRFCPWGYAIWRDRIDRRYNGCESGFRDVRMAYDRYSEFQDSMPQLFNWMLRHDPRTLNILKADSDGRICAGDVRLEYYLFRTGLVCVYPRCTMTNMMPSGLDAMHCTYKWSADEPLANCAMRFSEIPMKQDEVVYRRFLTSRYPCLLSRALFSLRKNGLRKTMGYYLRRLVGRDCKKDFVE